MSWVTAVPRCDDVFDEDVDELSVQNKEWTCNMAKRAKDGFRDGIDAGKAASLQQGFNVGYREGAAKMKAIGQFKGIISALRCWCQSQPSMSSEPITQLLEKVEKHEESLFEAMRKAQEQPAPSLSEIVGDMDALAVDQSSCEGSDCSRIDQGGECCRKSHNDCCGHDQDIGTSSAGIHTKSLFVKGENLEHLFYMLMELVTEMGLPEDLKRYIQQFRHSCI